MGSELTEFWRRGGCRWCRIGLVEGQSSGYLGTVGEAELSTPAMPPPVNKPNTNRSNTPQQTYKLGESGHTANCLVSGQAISVNFMTAIAG